MQANAVGQAARQAQQDAVAGKWERRCRCSALSSRSFRTTRIFRVDMQPRSLKLGRHNDLEDSREPLLLLAVTTLVPTLRWRRYPDSASWIPYAQRFEELIDTYDYLAAVADHQLFALQAA